MTSSVGRLAYLDHAATTPMRESAIAAMAPYLAEHYANPSGSHRFSRMARTAIDEARDDVADVLGCAPGEVVFTSGGTEGDNAAVFGAVRRHGGVAVCSAVEHHAVLHCVEHLHGEVVAADRFGLIDIAALKQTLERVAQRGERVAVVSVMAVNNEVGTITPMRDVARVVRGSAEHAVFHSDAVQAACWLDVRDIVAVTDVVSFSAHKFGGPKGMGVMVVKKGVTLEPLIMGGGQERDRRSGTSNVAGIVATAAALRETVTTREAEVVRVAELKRLLIEGHLLAAPRCPRNGARVGRHRNSAFGPEHRLDGAGRGTPVFRRRRERSAALPPGRSRRLRFCSLGLCERCNGTIARVASDGRAVTIRKGCAAAESGAHHHE